MKRAIFGLVVSVAIAGTALAQSSGPDVAADADIAVPEPTSLLLLLTGVGAGAAALLRRRK